jgi:thiol-disulfide isomerase/thioredoxin
MMKKSIFLMLLMPVLAASCATTHAGRLQYIELYSRDCNICNRMTPVLEAAAAKYGSVVDIESYGPNSDTGEDLEKKYNIKKYPANLFLDADGMIFFRYEGLLDQKSVEEILDRKIKSSGATRTAK